MKDSRIPSTSMHGSGVSTHSIGAGTSSIGIRTEAPKRAFARQLLSGASPAKPIPDPTEDKRPLIDIVREATFTDAPGLTGVFADLYGLRTLLNKAHCFTLTEDTSRMVADFSIAIADDLEAVRPLTLPPFPVTWIDIDNVARLKRVEQLGVKLTSRADGTAEGGPVERVGWLIHPDNDYNGFYMTYFTVVRQGVTAAPLSYWWHCGETIPPETTPDDDDRTMQGLTFGLAKVNVGVSDAFPSYTPLHKPIARRDHAYVQDMLREMAGELRHVWGLLLALNASQSFGVEATMTPREKHTDIRKMPNGKPLLPMEHKELHLHLRKTWTAPKVVVSAVTQHRKRSHDVRGHARRLPSGRIVMVKPHERGDRALGRIEKTYKVER